MKTSAFEIIFRIKDDYYLGGTIRASHDLTELFFHFPWGGRSQAVLHKVGSETNKKGCLPDHISFHRDGTVHTKGRDGRKKVRYFNKLELGINPFNLQRGHFLPIYLESINLQDESIFSVRLKKIEPDAEQMERCWDVSNLNYFSILLVSKCARVDPGRLLSNHGFEILHSVGSPAILADIFSAQEKKSLPDGCISGFDTQLLIWIVEESWPERPTISFPSTKNKSSLISTAVCMPPVESLVKMKNRNHSH